MAMVRSFLFLRSACSGGGRRTRAASAEPRTHGEVRAEEGKCSRRSLCRRTRPSRIDAKRRAQVTPAADELTLYGGGCPAPQSAAGLVTVTVISMSE